MTSGFRRIFIAALGWITRLPTALITFGGGLLKGILVIVAVAAVIGIAGWVLFGTVITASMAPINGILAFQPSVAASYGISASDASAVRQSMMNDPSSPLRCIARSDMSARPNPYAGPPVSRGASTTAPGGPRGSGKEVTDESGALSPELYKVIDQLPKGTDFLTSYAYVVTTLAGGTESWRAFKTTLEARKTPVPQTLDDSWKIVGIFFTDATGIHDTDALAASVMVRLTGEGRVPESPFLTEVFDAGLRNCRALSPEPTPATVRAPVVTTTPARTPAPR